MGLNQLLCPKCRKKITGRASDMENFLKVINDLISEEKCSAKDLFPSPQIFLTAFEFSSYRSFYLAQLMVATG